MDNARDRHSLRQSSGVGAGLRQSKVIQNERGEFVTIGEIEELPQHSGHHLKGSLAQYEDQNNRESIDFAARIKQGRHIEEESSPDRMLGDSLPKSKALMDDV